MKMDYLKMKIGYSKVKGRSQSFPGTGLNMFREPGRIFQELLILFVPFMMKNHNSKIDVKVVIKKRNEKKTHYAEIMDLLRWAVIEDIN